MPGGRSWKGQLVSRDGDWVVFSTSASAKPIRMGANTIEELVFQVDIDAEELTLMKQNREFERVIGALERVLEPYDEYSDIPSNLTKYNSLLMEMHYRVGDYDKSLAIASKISEDARDPALQERSRIYKVLALIASGDQGQAESLLTEYGWDKNLSATSKPAHLYISAKLLANAKNYAQAMQYVSMVIAFNSQDPDWMQPAELLCAEIYVELGMLDSAEEVVREISMLYKDTAENDAAQELKIRIESLRNQ